GEGPVKPRMKKPARVADRSSQTPRKNLPPSGERDERSYAGLSRLPLPSYSMAMVPTGQPSAASTICSAKDRSASDLTTIFSGTSNSSGQVASQAPHMVHSFSDSSSQTLVMVAMMGFLPGSSRFQGPKCT